MASFCYRFKLRIPYPREGKKLLSFKVMVPFKCRRLSGGRFGYSSMDSQGSRLLAKALNLIQRRGNYDTLWLLSTLTSYMHIPGKRVYEPHCVILLPVQTLHLLPEEEWNALVLSAAAICHEHPRLMATGQNPLPHSKELQLWHPPTPEKSTITPSHHTFSWEANFTIAFENHLMQHCHTQRRWTNQPHFNLQHATSEAISDHGMWLKQMPPKITSGTKSVTTLTAVRQKLKVFLRVASVGLWPAANWFFLWCLIAL